jgi:hypothetical protein
MQIIILAVDNCLLVRFDHPGFVSTSSERGIKFMKIEIVFLNKIFVYGTISFGVQ